MSAAIALHSPYPLPRRVPDRPTPANGPAHSADSDPLSHERALIIKAQQGETSAFSALVRIHQRRAYAVARAVVGTHEDAEDAEIGRASCRERGEGERVGVGAGRDLL